jgi:hypothetical protein
MTKGMHSTVASPTQQKDDEIWLAKADPALADTQKMLQTINFKLGNFDDDNRTFQAVASTPLQDRQGDSIDQSGWVLDNFVKNPVIPWAHCYWELPVGRATQLGVVDGNLQFTYQAPPAGLYDFADTVWAMYRAGFMFAFSVGFLPLEYDGNWEDGYNFTSCELLEISAVPVPANAGALVLAQKMGIMNNKQAVSMISKVEAALKNLKEANGMIEKKITPKEEVKADKSDKTDEKEQIEKTEQDNSKFTLEYLVKEVEKLEEVINNLTKEGESEIQKGAISKGAISSDLPCADKDTTWDKGSAVKAVKDWATGSDGEIDWSKYRKAFMWVDSAGGDKQGDYKLPFADVIDGKLQAVWNAVKAIYGVLQGARGGVNIPEEDKAAVMKVVTKYYKKFGEGTPGEDDSSSTDDGKSLTNEDNMVQNDNMAKTKSGATISADTKEKIQAVIDGLQEVVTSVKGHQKALNDLAKAGASSEENDDDTNRGDEPDENEPKEADTKSVDETGETDKIDKTSKTVTETKTDESKETIEGDVKSADVKSEDGADQEEKEVKKVEKVEEPEDDLIDPDNLSEEDQAKLVAAVQEKLEELDKTD